MNWKNKWTYHWIEKKSCPIQKQNFLRNTNMMFKFKVLFSFFFLLFQISGTWFSQAGDNFFTFPVGYILFSGVCREFRRIVL